MKVFVLNMRGRPLMPCSPAKARHLLKAGKAVVRRRTPFTIQLRIATGETKQNVTLGVDAGAKHVGLSATTEKEEVFASEVELRQDITGLLAARLSLRRDRRHRKTADMREVIHALLQKAEPNRRCRQKKHGGIIHTRIPCAALFEPCPIETQGMACTVR